MDKRYQVFVSSTYTDLKEERWKAIQAVIELDCIPAGMELFPAIDEEQFEFIKKVINDCDYYILIIGGRYGSTTSEGISYTEKEYDYAVGKGLKVIALIHGNPEDIPFGKSEKDPILRERLEQFKRKVSGGRLVKYWKSVDELYNHVTVSLVHTMNKFPAVGWIRANKAASEDLLTEINDLRKTNNQLQAAVAELTPKPKIENLAPLQDKVELRGKYWRTSYNAWRFFEATLTWSEIFASVAPYLVRFPNDEVVKSTLSSAVFTRSGHSADGEQPTLNDQQFRTVAVQLQALGLVKLQYTGSTTGAPGLFWSLTPSGERLMMELRTVKKASASEQVGNK